MKVGDEVYHTPELLTYLRSLSNADIDGRIRFHSEYHIGVIVSVNTDVVTKQSLYNVRWKNGGLRFAYKEEHLAYTCEL